MSATPDTDNDHRHRQALFPPIHTARPSTDDDKTRPVADGELPLNPSHAPHSRSPPPSKQVSINISLADAADSRAQSHEDEPPRSASVTSSLDPYYFGIGSPSQSPTLHHQPSSHHLSVTPDHPFLVEPPQTPARNPASIDRRGLVGVGELATPRWSKTDAPYYPVSAEQSQVRDDDDEGGRDAPDSPWTIEAIDGEGSDKEEECNISLEPPPRPLRTRPSIADESGGEEILYPRNVAPSLPDLPSSASEDQTKSPRVLPPSDSAINTPPSAFASTTRKARKRTSDEFELDQAGTLVSKRLSSLAPKDKAKDDLKSSTRKHRSLNMSSSASTAGSREARTREKRRESLGLGIISPVTKGPEKHSRQLSSGSVGDSPSSRRAQNASDYSHLPPSPASSSIQQHIHRHAAHASPASSTRKELPGQPSANVAHSLLRGTQEGWSALDDEATAEALRKLDGLGHKSARSRASFASLGRNSNSSRPSTPPSKGQQQQWEGMSASDSGKSRRSSAYVRVEKESGVIPADTSFRDPDSSVITSDDLAVYQEKTPKKSTRLSFTPKRGSASSTTYTSTPTTSSRDSATTNATSVSAASGRHSSNKNRRNSAGSDISSIHSSDVTHFKDRAAHLAAGELSEDAAVPPVPPLPKDLSSYRSPPTTSTSHTFPSIPSADGTEQSFNHDGAYETKVSLDVPNVRSPPAASSHTFHSHAHSDSVATQPAIDSSPVIVKTPVKKWSFSSALNLKLSSSPSSSSQKSSGFPLSPRSVAFGHGLRKSASKDKGMYASPVNAPQAPWTPEPDAMTSANSLASLSSASSVHNQLSSKTPDKLSYSDHRPGTDSSATTSALSADPSGALSPSASVKRGQSKRLTPSSIPFFRRSSSQSMQPPSSSGSGTASSPPPPPPPHRSHRNTTPNNDTSTSASTPASTHRKSSVLSLGLPSLLKSSSRRSLHAESKEAAKELQRVKNAVKESEKEKARSDKEKAKKDDKDRSESRISVLMGRKRGKTLSSTDPRKPKSPVNLPPMQISAIEPVTAQRVAKLKSGSSGASATSSISSRTSISSSRLTSHTVSSMQKQSDSSLRSRHQLPTIAGSPSVGTNGTSSTQTVKDHHSQSVLLNSAYGLTKETPTKIPRISSRTSAASSPSLKHSTSTLAGSRRASLNTAAAGSLNPSPVSTNEFGVLASDDGATPKVSSTTRQIRGSPSSVSRPQRQSSAQTVTANAIPRKSTRDSVGFMGLRKASTSSVNSTSTPASGADTSSSSHRFSALSPSRGLKLLGPKSSARQSTAASVSQASRQAMGSPSSSRQSVSTPSPVPSTVDDDEVLGDEEMMQYIRRQQTKKLAAGATQEELDELLKFPEPTAPRKPTHPEDLLNSSQVHALSEYERKEVLEYPNVYCIGSQSSKKRATLDNPTNNYGYDDERGDYNIVVGDHLAYRYEVVGNLGKGSFGQVLNCRDHCTGQSVAVKIIRNKKRFHHQALVEIKILDNLRKWDADGKHHVAKMIEHFYFRGHLCIAMELLSLNLYELIKANGFVGFSTALIRRFTSQMLLSLSLMRHHRIVHCDLKPENVLLRHPAKSAITVIDFGSSCFEHEKIYTYIQSRFYRSPEVILGMNYHMAIDMWSLGCILAELYTGFPIFPGENEQEQLSCIMEVLGVPDKEFVNRSSRKKLFFDTNGVPRTVVNSKGRRRRPGSKTLAQVLRCNDEEFIDFIAKCLIWEPERRMKPQAAMRHPFVTAGKRKAQIQSSKSSLASSISGSRSKNVTETPKKSMIGAPAPLSARTPRSAGNGVTGTPSAISASAVSSSRSYRTYQSQTLGSLGAGRGVNGYSSAK